MIFQRIYTSQRASGVSKLVLDDILKSCAANNPSLGITGLLLFESGTFLQVIEGPRQHVRALYERISNDPRHENIHVIQDRFLEQRSFPEWSMAFREIDTIEHHGRCMELTRMSIMNGPLKSCDEELREIVSDFFLWETPEWRGNLDLFVEAR